MDFLYLSILFAGYSVAYSWDSNGVDYEKRQLVPLPRIGRSYMEAKRQGLIPSPRVGRSSQSQYNGIENFETNCQLTRESCNALLEYRNRNLHEVHEGVGLPSLRLTPYAGRRKRSSSVAEDYNKDLSSDDFELTKTLRSNPWDLDVEQDFFQRNTRQLIPAPRVGRSGRSDNTYKNQLISGMSSSGDEDDLMIDPIDLQLRAAFIPRIGRAAFTPRIGKKAAFVPRIGRSAERVANDLDGTHSN